MIVIPFLISWITGFFLLRNILNEKNKLNGYLWFGLSLALGLGCSGILGFFSFIVLGKLNILALIILHSVCILILVISSRNHKWQLPTFTIHELPPIIIWGFSLFAAYIKSNRFPFGGWDAWALWNMKTKILIQGENWTDIFTHLSYHSQPDYPLMLPFINTWIYAISHAPLAWVNQIAACVLSATLGIILYGGLRLLLKPYKALILSLIIFLNPFYLLWSTLQYSDVLLSLYLLSTLIIFFKLFEKTNTPFLILTGILLGFMSFTKNEGIVISALLAGCLILGKLLEKGNSFKAKMLRIAPFIISLIIAGLPIIYFKLFLAPSNPDIPLFLDISTFPFFNVNGLKTIWMTIGLRLLNPDWNFIWIFIIALCALGLPSLKQKPIILGGLFFALYFCVLTYVYLTTKNFDLQWRLNNTLDRIFFILLPSLFYYSCIMVFNKKGPYSFFNHKK